MAAASSRLSRLTAPRTLGRRWRRWGQGALTAYLGGSRGVYALIEEFFLDSNFA